MNIDYLVQELSPKNAHLREFLTFIDEDNDVTDSRWIAYMIATCKHETAATFAPIKERGPSQYFDKYEPGTHLGIRLGNTKTGDGAKYKGRSYCQITGRENYTKFAKLLDIDLVTNPDLALSSEVAYKIMSIGMRKGLFTGVKLSQFFTPLTTDFLNARKIINGMDCAGSIANYAHDVFQLMREYG